MQQYSQQYYKEHSEEIKENTRQYQNEHREESKEYKRKYRQRDEVKKRKNKQQRQRKEEDECFCLRTNISRNIGKALKRNNNNKNGVSCLKCIGYTIRDLKIHLELQFNESMSWENYGSYWHIDHIIPQSYFNYESMDSEEFQKCWTLENLRPLEAKENMIKGNKLDEKLIIEKGLQHLLLEDKEK